MANSGGEKESGTKAVDPPRTSPNRKPKESLNLTEWCSISSQPYQVFFYCKAH